MTTRRARSARWRSWLLAAALAPGAGCASWNPFASEPDPMRTELARLEKEQRRQAEQQRVRGEAERRERDEKPATMPERLAQGDAHLAAGRLAEALWEYASAHRLDPDHPAPRVRLGYVHLRHNPERARPLFESAIAADPGHVSAHRGLGLALIAGREPEKGLAHLERAVELAPGSGRAHEALAWSLDRMGRTREAVGHLERAAELRPHDTRILNNLGVAYLRIGEPAQAERALREALRRDTRDEEPRYLNLGLALAFQGRFEEALAAFRRATDEQGALSNLGYAHYLRGEYAAAIEHYERALVAGGDADLQVVRNLEAARSARRDRRVPKLAPSGAPILERPPAPPSTEIGAAEPASDGEPPEPPASEGPWREGVTPAALGDYGP